MTALLINVHVNVLGYYWTDTLIIISNVNSDS